MESRAEKLRRAVTLTDDEEQRDATLETVGLIVDDTVPDADNEGVSDTETLPETVTVVRIEPETDVVGVNEGDAESDGEREDNTDDVAQEDAEGLDDTLTETDALPVAFELVVTLTVRVDDTDTVSDGDLLYVDETVPEEDIEFVTDAERQCVAVPERVEE